MSLEGSQPWIILQGSRSVPVRCEGSKREAIDRIIGGWLSIRPTALILSFTYFFDKTVAKVHPTFWRINHAIRA